MVGTCPLVLRSARSIGYIQGTIPHDQKLEFLKMQPIGFPLCSVLLDIAPSQTPIIVSNLVEIMIVSCYGNGSDFRFEVSEGSCTLVGYLCVDSGAL